MTWDVPTAEDCPECGQTLFKKSGKGRNKPFCINESCSRFLPEDKRGYYKKKTESTTQTEEKAEDTAAPKTGAKAKKAPAKKTASRKTGTGKAATKKAPAKKTGGTKEAAK